MFNSIYQTHNLNPTEKLKILTKLRYFRISSSVIRLLHISSAARDNSIKKIYEAADLINFTDDTSYASYLKI